MKLKLLILVILTSLNVFSKDKHYKGKHAFYLECIWEDMSNGNNFKDSLILKTYKTLSVKGKQKITYDYFPNPSIDTSIVLKIQSIFYDEVSPNSYRNFLIQNKSYGTSKTTLYETKNNLWFHPPRSRQFTLLELAPFPEYNQIDSSFSRTIFIGEHSYGKLAGEKIKSIYSIKTINNEIKKVFATSHSVVGEVKAVFTYLKGKGFTKFEYWFFNETHLTINIKEILTK